MRWRRSLFAFLAVAVSCSNPSVEQIKVEVPPGVVVPEGMAYIPAGEFIMGHPDDPKTERGKKVFLKAYLIDRYETTQARFREFKPGHSFQGGKDKFPASRVTFQEAEDYCRQAGKRLPAEAEWEKAARGVDGRKWPWSGYIESPNDGFSGFIPEEVDKRPEWVSPFGIYGMGYNVWEWVSDGYSYQDMPEKDKGKFKAVRGGPTQTHLTVKFTPAYFRNWMDPEARYNFIGFRCAMDAE
ncbi:MAG: SUMF1/EgtB/PvdO family nonheme iron enzyme [Nitrospinae bacterium]|nr:SUMF1/EgtB/PvdO family nonheme iron enzyme [Nitrospinota bacterium]